MAKIAPILRLPMRFEAPSRIDSSLIFLFFRPGAGSCRLNHRFGICGPIARYDRRKSKYQKLERLMANDGPLFAGIELDRGMKLEFRAVDGPRTRQYEQQSA